MTTTTIDPTFAQAVQQANHTWITSLAQGDGAGAAAVYSQEAQAFVPNLGLVSGKAAILAAYQGAVENGLRQVTLNMLELAQDGTLAYETGTYSILNEQGTAATESGHYMIIWQQEAGQWKWHRHMWNYHFKAG